MSQRRYVNFGADANAGSIKAINREFFAPQVLRGNAPFLSTTPPDQLVLQPHSIIFDTGIVLTEDQQLEFTVPTGYPTGDYTLLYQHVDEDVIGGVGATIELRSGLFQSLESSIILGWVRYPGGAVPLDNSMVFENQTGQLTPQHQTREIERLPTSIQTISLPATATITHGANVLLDQTIPTSPYQIDLGDAYVSRLLPIADQRVRIINQTDGVEMTRITAGSPTTNQYLLSPSTQLATFASADTGKVVDMADITYGTARLLTNSSTTQTVSVDSIVTFNTNDMPFSRVTAQVIGLNQYAIQAIEVLDVDSEEATINQTDTIPTVPDGSISQLVIRMLDGTYSGNVGRVVVVRLRETVGPVGSGLLLGVRASNRDLPF